MSKKNRIPVFNPETGNTEYLAGKWDLCPLCDGEGCHTNPSIDGNGLTSSDLEDWDDETFDNYFGGLYDVQCWFCGGDKVVLVPDESLLDLENSHRDKLLMGEWEEWFEDKLSGVQRSRRIAGGSYEMYQDW